MVLLSVLTSVIIIVGSSLKKVWILILFPCFELLNIGSCVWAYLLTANLLLDALYLLVIFFKIFFIISSIGLITLIRRDEYLKSLTSSPPPPRNDKIYVEGIESKESIQDLMSVKNDNTAQE